MTQTRINYIILAVLILAVIALAIMLGAGMAFAQVTVTPPPAELNAIGQISLDVLTWVATAAIATVTGFLSNFLRKLTVMQRNQSEGLSNERLSSIIYKGIDYATVAYQNEVNKPGSGLTAVRFDNTFLAMVTGFVKSNAPELLDYFGLNSDPQSTSPRLNTMIMARLAPYVGSTMIGGAIPGSMNAVSPQADASFSLPSASVGVPTTTASASGG